MKLPRNAQLWFGGWRASLRDNRRHCFDRAKPITLHLMFADHYEPYWGKPTDAVAQSRVDRWAKEWPAIANANRDDDGRPAKWSFFYPQEEYRAALLQPLADFARAGIGDVEIHIHHDGEGEADFVERMRRFIGQLTTTHGLLHAASGAATFGFIHGNWALDNSRPDGRWCGLNNELTLLRELGCYADFTMPAAPDPCQTTTVNAIYWAVDDPSRPKSHDRGARVTPGAVAPANALLCVQGPLALRAHPRWKIIPTVDVGELAGYAPPAPGRAHAWLEAAPRIGNDVFLKLYTHGAPEKNAVPLLGGDIARTIADVRAECGRRNWRLAFATARELVAAIDRARGAT